MPTFRKVAIVLLLAAFLASGASATGSWLWHPTPATGEASPPVLFNRAWAYLTSLWNKTGCKLDPDGRCITVPDPVPSSEGTGCKLDPNGLCGS
jgi:hypothetical protein